MRVRWPPRVKIGKLSIGYGDVCLAVRGACRVLESNRRTALQIVEIAPFVGLEHVGGFRGTCSPGLTVAVASGGAYSSCRGACPGA